MISRGCARARAHEHERTSTSARARAHEPDLSVPLCAAPMISRSCARAHEHERTSARAHEHEPCLSVPLRAVPVISRSCARAHEHERTSTSRISPCLSVPLRAAPCPAQTHRPLLLSVPPPIGGAQREGVTRRAQRESFSLCRITEPARRCTVEITARPWARRSRCACAACPPSRRRPPRSIPELRARLRARARSRRDHARDPRWIVDRARVLGHGRGPTQSRRLHPSRIAPAAPALLPRTP